MKRYLDDVVRKDTAKKMVLVAGPRQVGKTTLARSWLGSSQGYLNWDIPDQRTSILKREWPDQPKLVFDEIHRYRGWRNYLKGFVDLKGRSVQVLVTGSARLDLFRFGGDTLQGRYFFHRFHPLSVAELGISSEKDFRQLLTLGGFPEPFLSGSEADAKRWARNYRSRLLEEEISSIERIHDLGKMELLAIRLPDLVGSPTKPMPVRLFETRLQKYIAAVKAGEEKIAEETVAGMREDIAKLPHNNVVVLDAKSKIERLDDAFWKHLNDEKQLYLQKEIAPLMRTRSNEDFKAMSLEINVLQLSIARLQEDAKKIETLEQVIVEKVSDLPLSVNTVAKHKELVESIVNEGHVHKADDQQLQEIVTTIGPLMRFREEGFKIDQEKLNLRDITAAKQMIEFGPANERVTVQKYREKVEALIKKLEEDNPILQKVKKGKSLSKDELEQLADTLEQYEPYPNEQNF
jgi:hypothetical protein